MRRICVLVACLLVAPAAAQAAPPAHHNHESPEAVRSYWTKERMRGATPVDRIDRAGRPKENAKPGAGAAPTPAPASSVEVVVQPGTPLTAHGKVFFSDSGVDYVCSGTALEGDVVWTAGHCVNEGPGSYYTSFLFVPAYRDGAAPYGRFPAPTLLTTTRWRTGANEYGVDLGAAITARNEAGQTLTEAVVERPIVFNALRGQSYSLFGYPAAKRFNGQRMRVCNTAWSRDDTSVAPATLGVPCDMTGGSSGGGWVTAAGYVASVVSYGYGSIKNVLFGPRQEAEAQELYAAAVAAAP